MELGCKIYSLVLMFLLILIQCLDKSLSKTGFSTLTDLSVVFVPDFKVNQQPQASWDILYPRIAVNAHGTSVIVWADLRNGDKDIYIQSYNKFGYPLYGNKRVNDVRTGILQHPDISMDSEGNFLIVWMDSRKGSRYYNIYAQRFNMYGTPIGTNFRVDQDSSKGYVLDPAVAMNDHGQFVVVWCDGRSGEWSQYQLGIYDIFFQYYSDNATPIGQNTRVNDDPGHSYQRAPAVDMSDDGSFVIAWQDQRNKDRLDDIYIRSYNASSQPLGKDILVNDDTGTAFQNNPDIIIKGQDEMIVTWEDGRKSSLNIFAQRMTVAGNPLGTNFKVNDDGFSHTHLLPSIQAAPGHGFIIAWEDRRQAGNRPEIFSQWFDEKGNPIGLNFKLSSDMTNAARSNADIALWDQFLISTWQDDRDSPNNDVFANIIKLSQPQDTVSIPQFNPLSGSYSGMIELFITCPTVNAEIRYTLDGSDPTLSSALYTGSILIKDNTTVKARAFKNDFIASPIVSGEYLISQLLSLQGQISTLRSGPVPDVTVTLAYNQNQDSTITDYGRYRFDHLTSGTEYMVLPRAQSLFFLPPVRSYDNLSASLVNQNFLAAYYGDVSGNDDISSFDASLILRHVVGDHNWNHAVRDSTSADVSGDGTISSLDASYILRYQVKDIPSFPVVNQKMNKGMAQNKIQIRLGPLAPDKEVQNIPIFLDHIDSVFAIDLHLQIDPQTVQIETISKTNATHDWMSSHRFTNKDLSLSLAGNRPMLQDGPILYLSIKCTENFDHSALPLKITRAVIDEQLLEIEKQTTSATKPYFILYQNFPNPFHAKSRIKFQITDSHADERIVIQILNIQGQLVRSLCDSKFPSGIHSVVWEGTDNTGRIMPSGVYICRLSLRNRYFCRKMSFIH